MLRREDRFTAQKMKFSIKDFFSICTFTDEILNGKLHFLCSEHSCKWDSGLGNVKLIQIQNHTYKMDSANLEND